MQQLSLCSKLQQKTLVYVQELNCCCRMQCRAFAILVFIIAVFIIAVVIRNRIIWSRRQAKVQCVSHTDNSRVEGPFCMTSLATSTLFGQWVVWKALLTNYCPRKSFGCEGAESLRTFRLHEFHSLQTSRKRTRKQQSPTSQDFFLETRASMWHILTKPKLYSD